MYGVDDLAHSVGTSFMFWTRIARFDFTYGHKVVGVDELYFLLIVGLGADIELPGLCRSHAATFG